MSVPDQPTVFVYTGNGVTTTFAYGCYLLSEEDLVVSIDDVVQTTGYTVNGIGSQSGGSVIFTVAPANGAKVVILRQVAIERITDYQRNGDLRAQTLNQDFDRIWMALQDNARDKRSSIRYPIFENLDGELATASTRALMLLGFDPNGRHTLYPFPTSIGAGDMRVDTFVSAVDFTPDVTTQLTLSRPPGSPANLEIFFDAAFQGPDQWSVSGAVVTFSSPIPLGVTKVFARIGTTLSIAVPPVGSVGDDELQWANILSRECASIAELRTLDKAKYNRASVTSYYGDGKGGGGKFWLDASDAVTADNGGTVIVANDGGRWKLIYDVSVDVKQFGARVDGVETSAQLQAAHDSGVKSLVYSDGDYLIGTTITPPTSNQDIIFHKNARLKPTVNGITAFKSTVSAYYVRFLSPAFHGNGKTGFVGMDMKNMRLYSGLLYAKFEAMDTGFIGRDGCFGLHIVNATAEACAFPVQLVENNSATVIECPNFDNGSGVGGNGGGTGVTIQGTGSNLGVVIRGGYIQGFEQAVFDNGIGTTVRDLYIENCTEADIKSTSGRQCRYENLNHWGNVGPLAYKLDGTDACVVCNPTMGSGARGALFDVDATNTNFAYFVNGSNASLNTPLGTVVGAQFNGRSNQTFTPTVAGATTPGVGTYSAQQGRISLHSGQVDIAMTVAWTAHSGSGNLVIKGIPAGFAPQSYNPSSPTPGPLRIGHVVIEGIPYTGPVISAFFNGNGTDISIEQVATSGAVSLLTLPATGTIHLKMSYNANA